MFITQQMPRVICEEPNRINLSVKNGQLNVCLQEGKPISFFSLVWDFDSTKFEKILSDSWGVADGDLGWYDINYPQSAFWYFTLYSEENTVSFGVKTGCNSFCSWKIDQSTITLTVDVRNGGGGVHLLEDLDCCTVVSSTRKEGQSVFDHIKEFCKIMCDKPNLWNKPIYGFNNWYYAYGNITHASVLKDAELCSLLASGRVEGAPAPYMVIDDGWSQTRTDVFNGGPYIPTGDFGNMRVVADEIYERGCTPGIWVRPLNINPELCPDIDENCFSQNQTFIKDGFSKIIDPTVQRSKEYIFSLVRGLADSGYRLIKHDFTCPDFMGPDFLKANLTSGEWHLQDKSRTNAQILKDLYSLIQDAADGGLVIGCNTYNHLVAGIHQITRSGGDTSGHHWWLTRKTGINSLVYRLAQNGTFFTTDADCAAFTDRVPIDKNLDFAELIARCNSALFVSAAPNVLKGADIDRLIEIFRLSSSSPDGIEFVDWMEKQTPERFVFDKKEYRYNWYE